MLRFNVSARFSSFLNYVLSLLFYHRRTLYNALNIVPKNTTSAFNPPYLLFSPLPSYCTALHCTARYVSAKAKGRADLDWSAIGMDISETAGIDVSKDVARNIQDVKDGRTY